MENTTKAKYFNYNSYRNHHDYGYNNYNSKGQYDYYDNYNNYPSRDANVSGSYFKSGKYNNYRHNNNYKNSFQLRKKDYSKREFNTNEKVGSIYNQNQRVKEEEIDEHTAQMLIYRAEMYILLRYPYLIYLNNKSEDVAASINESSFFFVIKSFSEEDVHKAIKYNVWTSTKIGNQTLSNSFRAAKEKGGEVYLFFSSNGSGRFVGVAKMKNDVDTSLLFPFWSQDNKWGGLFNLEWIFIKDIPFNMFKDVVITLKDGKRRPVSYSRDTQEIPLGEGVKMMKTVQEYANNNTLLEHFEYYDLRQENYEKNNPDIQSKITLSQN